MGPGSIYESHRVGVCFSPGLANWVRTGYTGAQLYHMDACGLIGVNALIWKSPFFINGSNFSNLV